MPAGHGTAAMIGVFDSGFGGLTILRELVRRLPQYDYLYLADRARGPYGALSADVINAYTRHAVAYLFNRGCELVVVACNTASARALRNVPQRWSASRWVTPPASPCRII
jgi:glutamate racemase